MFSRPTKLIQEACPGQGDKVEGMTARVNSFRAIQAVPAVRVELYPSLTDSLHQKKKKC